MSSNEISNTMDNMNIHDGQSRHQAVLGLSIKRFFGADLSPEPEQEHGDDQAEVPVEQQEQRKRSYSAGMYQYTKQQWTDVRNAVE